MNKKQIINTDKAPSPIGPYNQSILVNDMLFISGQIPLDLQTQEIIQDIEEATHLVMAHLKNILAASHLTFEDVVKATIFLKSMDDFAQVNAVYGQYFLEETAPVRETVAVKELPKNAPIEISLIALAKKE